MKIYLAGPLGFSEAGCHFQSKILIPKLKHLGHKILNPWEGPYKSKAKIIAGLPYGQKKRNEWKKLNPKIGKRNQTLIGKCDAVFAVLDGPDVDSGTAAEIGYAYAKDRPILGYRGDFRLSADNEGSTVNLQVEYFIHESGGEIISSLKNLDDALKKIHRLRYSR